MEADTSRKIMSTIYRQNWPPPHAVQGSIRGKKFENTKSKELAGNLWREGAPFREKHQAVSTRQSFKTNRSVVDTNKIRRPVSCYRRERPQSAALNLKENNKTKDTQVDKVEYLTMLSSKNYLRKMYREQLLEKNTEEEKVLENRAVTPAKITIGYNGVDMYKYYPDMGSVIARPHTRKCVMSASSTPIYPREGWKLTNKNKQCYDETSSDSDKKPNQCEINFDSDSSITSSRSTTAFTFSSRATWSNVPMGKSFRVQKQTIDTLASISLEGKATIHQTRHPRSKSSSSFQSCISETPQSNRLSSAGESVSSTASIDFESSQDETKPECDVDLDQIYIDDEEYERTKSLIDPAMYVDNKNNDLNQLFNQNVSQCRRKESVISIDSEDNFDSDSTDSDATEWGNADEYENKEVFNQEEVERKMQQVSAVFSTQSGESENREIVGSPRLQFEREVNEPMSELSFSDEEEKQVNEMKYAEVLSPPFNTLDPKLLANLPPEVDWRTCIDLPRYISKLKTSLEGKRTKYRSGSHKANKQKRIIKSTLDKSLQMVKENELFIDKLVNLEKLQSLTVQYEKERKLHLQHIQRARSRNSRQRRPSTTSEKSSPTKQLTVEQELSRLIRPISVTPNSDISKQDELKHKNLLRTTSSQSIARRSTTYRRPWQPRIYDYTLSERFKDSRGQLTLRSLSYPKAKTCTSCRDRIRKMSANNAIVNRPSSTTLQSNGNSRIKTTPRTTIKWSTTNSQKLGENDNSVHGLSYVDNDEPTECNKRQPYPFGHASVKGPTMFSSRTLTKANTATTTVGKQYFRVENSPSRKKSVPFLRPRTSSLGTQRKRNKNRGLSYYNPSEIKFGVL